MKKNRNTLLILITVALAVIVIILYLNPTKSTLKKDQTGFAVADSSKITKIFLADKMNRTVLLKKERPGYWTVNEHFRVRNNFITLLLGTLSGIHVKSPVARSAAGNVVKRIAAIGIKAEIYENDEEEPAKVYYVGDATQDGYGTYMIMENSVEPFIVFVPGFYGYLTPRYSTWVDDWRVRTVFDVPFKELRFVTAGFPQRPRFSFRAENSGEWKFSLKASATDSLIANYDTLRLMRYLVNFSDVNFEGFVRNDSIRKFILSTPVQCLLAVGSLSGETHHISAYMKPMGRDTTSVSGRKIEYDPDRMYALVDDSLFVTIQYYVFDKLFLTLDDFCKRNPVKKNMDISPELIN